MTCAAGGYCGFNTAVGYAGCCNTALTIDYTLYSLSDCNVQTACYDSTDASSYTSAASTDASLAVWYVCAHRCLKSSGLSSD